MRKTTRCVTAHEAVTRGGFGAELAAVVQQGAFDYLDAPIERVGAKFAPLAVRAGDGAVGRSARGRRARGGQADGGAGLAMATEVKLPRLGQGMESGTIVKWLKGEGEAVKKREPLYELDTDKVTQEVEAEADGVLLKIVVDSGEVEVGKTIALIGSEGEEVPSENGRRATEQKEPRRPRADDAAEAEEEPEAEGSPAPDMDDERERGRQAAAATAEAETQPSPTHGQTDGRVKASPLARRLARETRHRHRAAARHRPGGADRRRGRRAGGDGRAGRRPRRRPRSPPRPARWRRSSSRRRARRSRAG